MQKQRLLSCLINVANEQLEVVGLNFFVLTLLRKINANKAIGLDKIPSKVLKIDGDTLAPSLTAIFNQSLSTRIFPHYWKMARVFPVFKNSSKLDLNNYRPISVIPLIAKTFEKLVYDQLCHYLNTNNLLSNCQSEFWSLHGTLTALLEATNNWCVNTDKGFLNGVIFLDLKKAFDIIDHEIVIQKLVKYLLGINSVVSMATYPLLIKLVAASLKVL